MRGVGIMSRLALITCKCSIRHGFTRAAPATSGDIFAYCKFCAPSEKCLTLIKEGHAGNITGVKAEAYRDHGWHAGQAFNILANLSAVCPFYS